MPHLLQRWEEYKMCGFVLLIPLKFTSCTIRWNMKCPCLSRYAQVLACPLIQLLAGRAATFSHMNSLLCGQCFQCYHRRCAGSLTEAAAVQNVCFAPCSSDATAGRRGSDSTTLQQCPLQKPAHQALGCSN